MKIAVNTRLLLKDRLEGIGWFTHECLSRIVRQHPEHQFYFLFDRAYDESFVYAPNVTPVVTHPQARHPYLWYLFFEVYAPTCSSPLTAGSLPECRMSRSWMSFMI